MIIKQMLNNNVVIAENEKKEEIVVMGRGIAFGAKKGQGVCKDRIEKVFTDSKDYDFSRFAKLISEIDLENFEFIESQINYAIKSLDKKLNNSIYITLTDHINTLIERAELGAYVKNSMLWDIKRFYKKEFEISKEIVRNINDKLGSKFDDNEAACIAIHIVNSELDSDVKTITDITNVVSEILNIVKYYFKVILNEDSLAYHRFVTHLRFFTERIFSETMHSDQDEDELFEIVKLKYNDTYECVKKIKKFILKEYKYELNNTECLYLTIHITKVVRESKKI